MHQRAHGSGDVVDALEIPGDHDVGRVAKFARLHRLEPGQVDNVRNDFRVQAVLREDPLQEARR